MATNTHTEDEVKQEQNQKLQDHAVHALTATERALVGICEDILEREGIGLRDDLFDDLKATSLDLIRIFGRVNEHFSLSLQASVLGSEPTLARLASCIDAQRPVISHELQDVEKK
jgi:acyl carrier protein